MMFDQPVLYLDAEHYPMIAAESKQALTDWFASVGMDFRTCQEMWRYEDEVLLIQIDLETSKRWKQILTSWRVMPAVDLPVLDMRQEVERHLHRPRLFQSEGITT